MRVLVACEFSGVVRNAFAIRGHDAVSCDLLPTERINLRYPESHYQGDVFEVLDMPWDLMIAFPPCTYLCISGARWWADRKREQSQAIRFVKRLLNAPIPRIALENPIGILSTAIRKPEQIIHPWQFGHGETKSTCLWLKNLPLLKPTRIVDGREPRIHTMSPGANRSRNRSRTYQGIANAMASQWGGLR